MYKVFVNDHLIILTDNREVETHLPIVEFDLKIIPHTVDLLLNDLSEGICFITSDLDKSWDDFVTSFKFQIAGGGLVMNKRREVLFIYRYDKWDLPKGKQEKGESIQACAMREVEEECGISGISIIGELDTTFHIFKRSGNQILKKTHWFKMYTSHSGKLYPQMEEGITVAEFKNEQNVEEALRNSYANIKLLFAK